MKDILKIILFGERDPGKTSMISRYVYNLYSESQISTIGISYQDCGFDFLGKKIEIKLWDTGGKERYRPITKPYIKGSDIIILVYSVDNRRSFEIIKKYLLPTVKEEYRKDGK